MVAINLREVFLQPPDYCWVLEHPDGSIFSYLDTIPIFSLQIFAAEFIKDNMPEKNLGHLVSCKIKQLPWKAIREKWQNKYYGAVLNFMGPAYNYDIRDYGGLIPFKKKNN